jgi:hypothetical protein
MHSPYGQFRSARVGIVRLCQHVYPWIFLPILVGEGTLALWLLIAGVNSAKWDAIARTQTV